MSRKLRLNPKRMLLHPWPVLLLGAATCWPVEAAIINSTSGGNVPANGPSYTSTSNGALGIILLASGNGSTITGGPTLTMQTSGSNADAVVAQSNGSIILSALTLTTTGANSDGLNALSGGTITISGPATLTTSSDAIYVTGAGSSITGSNVTATASGSTSLAARVENGGNLTLNGTASSLKNNINGNYVVSVTGTGSQLNLTNTAISSNAATNLGIYLANSATLNMTGGSIAANGTDMETLSVDNSTANLTGTTLSGSGLNAVIVYARHNGQVTLNNAQIQLTGNTNIQAMSALVAESGSTITMNGGSISYTGNGGNGANSFFSGSNLNLNGVSINTNGTGSWGVLSQAGALHIQDSNIVTQGANSDGVHLSDNYTTFGGGSALAFAGNNTILTQGPTSHGVAIDGGVQLTFNPSSNPVPAITVQGMGSALLYADGQGNSLPSKITVQNTQLANGGTFAGTIGAFANNGAQFDFQPGSGATMNGTGSDALRIVGTGSLINGDQATFSVNGDGAHDANLSNGGTLTLSNSTMTAQGNNANALFMSGTGNNSATLTDTNLSSTAGPVINVAGGNALISLTRALIDSSGGIAVQVGPGASTSIQTDNTHIIGSIQTDSSSSSTLVLTNNSLWDMTDSSTVTELNNDPSIIQFAAPVGGVFKTLTVRGNYQGDADSLVVLNTQLGADNSPTDKLVVLGSTSGGTGLRIVNAGGSGALTVADGIEVVQVGGASNGVFTLASPVVAGAYEYGLYKGGQSGAGNWYLRSSAPPTNPENPDPPDPPNPPGTPRVPITPISTPVTPPATAAAPVKVYRGDAGAYLANQAAASGMFLFTLHDRLGEPQFTDNNRQQDGTPSAWVRATSSRADSKAGNGGEFDLSTDASLVQIGAELARWTDNSDNRFHLGIMGGYGRADNDSDMRNPDGVLKHSSGTVDGYSAGLYATWFGNQSKPSGPYVDLWALYGWYDNSVDYANTPTQNYNSHGVTVSIEAGYAFLLRPLSNDRALMLEPQAQVAYTDYRADKHVDYSGTVIDSNDNGVITRLGARLYSRPLSGQGAQPFIEANWWHSDSQAVSFNDTAIDSQVPKDRYEFKAGVQGEMAKGWQGWMHVGYMGGSDGYHRWEALLGIKHLF